MYSGIIGSACVAYDVPAAMKLAVDPASLIPSCRIWPLIASLYDRNSSRSTEVYVWPCGE